jgi:hypothetical protein
MRKDSSSRRIKDLSEQQRSIRPTPNLKVQLPFRSHESSDLTTALSDPFTSTAPKVPEDALQFDLTTQRIGESDRYLQFRFFWNGLDGNCDEHIQVQHNCPHLEALKRNPSAYENPPTYRYLGERRGNVLPIAFRYTLVDGKASDYEAIQWNEEAESLYANFTAKTKNLRRA